MENISGLMAFDMGELRNNLPTKYILKNDLIDYVSCLN